MMPAGVNVHDLLGEMLSEQTFPEDISVTDITLDSHHVSTGSLFLSLAKNLKQRSFHLSQAVESGAVVAVYDSMQPLLDEEKKICHEYNVSTYSVNHLSYNIGEIAAKFYGYPSKNLTIIGITGTNGKTSVSHFVAQAFESLNIPCGVIGSLGVGRMNQLRLNGMTTPNPVTLQAVLSDFKRQEIDYVVIEASSHGLKQWRLNSVDIDIAVLTNISRDHLDYHQTMDSYTVAKRRLFQFSSVNHAVIN